ncbi:MAG: DUF1186 domain-containing protein [Anaerolineae bacterium]|nr:DUF1186 domain-containing protein [Anaerolineae bacterium]
MTNTKQTYPEPVAGLMTLGDVRKEPEWCDYLSFGFTEQHVPDLCRMILDRDLFWADSESDEVWSAVHAWRTLAQLKADSAIPCLIELLGRVDEYDDDWTSEELPKVFGLIGPPALEPLRVFLADAGQGEWSRTGAGNALVNIGQRHPELRADCITILSRQLEQFVEQEESFNANLVSALLDLQGVEAAPVIEQAFAANKVDLMMQGDWEDVQIELGLLNERLTSAPDLRGLMAERMGFDPRELINRLKREDTAKSQWEVEQKASKKAKTKAKAKRKQAKASRKKQRNRK